MASEILQLLAISKPELIMVANTVTVLFTCAERLVGKTDVASCAYILEDKIRRLKARRGKLIKEFESDDKAYEIANGANIFLFRLINVDFSISFLFPKNNREEITGDLFEIKRMLINEGYNWFVVHAIFCFQVVVILVNVWWAKLRENVFESTKTKVED